MTNTSKQIVFFGTDEFSALSLKALLEAGVSIAAVVTKPDSRKGRGRTLSPSVVKTIAQQHGIPVWQPTKIVDIIDDVETLGAPLGVLVSYGKIIPEALIKAFEPGIINVHPSLLPRYRGPSPVETAILNGDHETGVTIMQLSAAMDAGPIYQQIPYTLTGQETTPELETRLGLLGAKALIETLDAIQQGSAVPTPQDDAAATYCQLLKKEDALLDTAHLSAAAAERQVRAFIQFPKTKSTVAGQSIVITKAHVSEQSETILDIPCSDGKYLRIDALIGPSGKAMDAKSFLNGYA